MIEQDYICPPVTNFWGLVEYQAHWGLTLPGWLLLILVLSLLFLLIISQIHPFLAYKKPIKADTLIVEGWVADEIVKAAINEFETGNYQRIITTGAPLLRGHYLCDYKNLAELSAATLITLGFDANKIVKIPSPIVKLNRTAAAAIEVRQWLLESKIPIEGINIFSYDVHTRRSWLIYQKILAPDYQVGAIAYSSPYYDTKHWWTSSTGVKSIILEAISYIYARLFSYLY